MLPMAYISYIAEDEASERLRELYTRYRHPLAGHPPNILRIQSHNPASMEKHFEFYSTVVKGPSPLSQAQREMIAVVVSAANECRY